MSVATEINQLQTLVEKCLEQDYRLRDSDKKLSCRIWTMQMGGIANLKSMTAYELLVKYSADDSPLYSQESIGRARRKLQEENPLLRGDKWTEKHGQEEAVINEIKHMEKG